MTKIVTVVLDTVQLYTLPENVASGEYAGSLGLDLGSWVEVDMEDFPGTLQWGCCFDLVPNGTGHPTPVFNLQRAKDLALEKATYVYKKKSNQEGSRLSQVQLLIELSLPEAERDPAYSELIGNLSIIRSQYNTLKSEITESSDIVNINSLLKSIETTWGVDMPGTTAP
jgi:hypothetical protein